MVYLVLRRGRTWMGRVTGSATTHTRRPNVSRLPVKVLLLQFFTVATSVEALPSVTDPGENSKRVKLGVQTACASEVVLGEAPAHCTVDTESPRRTTAESATALRRPNEPIPLVGTEEHDP